MKHSDPLAEPYLFNRWQQCCEGDKSAFAEITELNYAALYHYGTRFTQDRDLIKDCIQDLFLNIWEKRARLSHISALRPYLFQSLRNNLIHRLRRQSLFSDIDNAASEPPDDVSPEADWIFQETDQLNATRLRSALDTLPKRQREALYLRYYENLSYEEIAVIMGLQRQAVANYLQYGIQKLREYWQHAAVSFLFLFDFFPK
ncbi:RNA polymerase sigma factor [Dyadobacter sandarakinus]|uniref:Sigma-70 family RNA polymerase sigma factor n=1 Tax=Dyadobacter sandarakinus TaxID=2747268 RepID=A0ABX7I8F4_9BACT|nr:sigma-70 family RNA polymerase sigma factor [Dyadobacter sandarakinus]QRR02160.1 sigma-70 family RNA polymerase sigma factor [Dyadobacter sandarakinus]